jgi:chromosome segregation ATPase
MDRFQQQIDKLDDRFERLDDKVDNVKLEVVELRSDIKRYTSEIVKHVNGDEKIVTEIMPTLAMFRHFVETDLKEIKDIILKEKAKEINEKEVIKSKESFKLSATIFATVAGIVVTIIGIYNKFKS